MAASPIWLSTPKSIAAPRREDCSSALLQLSRRVYASTGLYTCRDGGVPRERVRLQWCATASVGACPEDDWSTQPKSERCDLDAYRLCRLREGRTVENPPSSYSECA
jgi:hypothetical protein